MRIIVTTTVEIAPGFPGDAVTESASFTEKRTYTEGHPSKYAQTALDAMRSAGADIVQSIDDRYGAGE